MKNLILAAIAATLTIATAVAQANLVVVATPQGVSDAMKTCPVMAAKPDVKAFVASYVSAYEGNKISSADYDKMNKIVAACLDEKAAQNKKKGGG